MNTTKSDKLVKRFLDKGQPFKRTIQEYSVNFNSPAKDVFPQLCPSREADWIHGWTSDLIYTTTGYAEKDCIFMTGAENKIGPGLWIFTGYELNKKVELVRIIEHSLVMHMRIHLDDHGDGTSTGKWNLTITALDDQGNEIIDNMPDDLKEISDALNGLDQFLNTGEMKKQ
jgi:hypothetical protein